MNQKKNIKSVIFIFIKQGNQIFEFFFDRGFVQCLTLYVFAFIIVLLGNKVIISLRRNLKINAASKRIRDIAAPAISSNERIVKDKKIKIHNIYKIINFLDFLLSAIGIFGTLLGLSNSLFDNFSEGGGIVKVSQQIVTALSTLLDTTGLDLAYAKLVGGFAWVMGSIRYRFIEQYTSLIRKIFLLEKLAAELKNNNKPVINNSHPISFKHNNINREKMKVQQMVDLKNDVENYYFMV